MRRRTQASVVRQPDAGRVRTYPRLSSTLVLLVRLQAGSWLVMGTLCGLFAALISRGADEPDGWFTRHDVSLAVQACLAALAGGTVLLLTLRAARNGSAVGRLGLVCAEVVLLTPMLVLAGRGALAGVPVILTIANGVTLGSLLAESRSRR